MRRKMIDIADKAAIFISGLCVVHCLVLPVVLIAMPAVSFLGFLSDELFHQVLVFFVIPISVLALVSSYVLLKNRKVINLVGFGIVLLVLAATIGHDFLGEVGEVVLTVIGSLFIAFGHLKNLKLRKQYLATQINEESSTA